MIKEIEDAYFQYPKKFNKPPELIFIGYKAYEDLLRNPLVTNYMPPWEIANRNPKYMGMMVVIVSDEKFGFELYSKDLLDFALNRYERNLYPSSSIRVDVPKYEVSHFTDLNAEPEPSIIEVDSIEISQSVILAYKRHLENQKETLF